MYYDTKRFYSVSRLQSHKSIACCEIIRCKQHISWCLFRMRSNDQINFRSCIFVWILSSLHALSSNDRNLLRLIRFYQMFRQKLLDLCECMLFSLIEESLLTRFEVVVLKFNVISSSNILFDLYSVCVKNLREHFFEWLRKSMIWKLHCLLLSISRIWFRTIHNFRLDDVQLICWQRDLNRILSYLFILLLSYIKFEEIS